MGPEHVPVANTGTPFFRQKRARNFSSVRPGRKSEGSCAGSSFIFKQLAGTGGYWWVAPRKSEGSMCRVLFYFHLRIVVTSTRPAGLINSPGPQAVSIHQARRPYQLTRSAGLINSPGHFFGLVGPFPVKPQISHSTATPLHRHPNPQLPYPTATPFTRSASLFDSPGPQALLIHKVRRPHQSTWPAGLIN